jgi:hypothetical protein
MNVVSVRVRVLSSLMSTRSSHWDYVGLIGGSIDGMQDR